MIRYLIAKNPEYDEYQRGFASMVYKILDKKFSWLTDKSASDGAIKIEIMSNKELAEDWHKPIIRKFKKRKVYSPFMDNIWDADFADKQLIIGCSLFHQSRQIIPVTSFFIVLDQIMRFEIIFSENLGKSSICHALFSKFPLNYEKIRFSETDDVAYHLKWNVKLNSNHNRT